MNNKETTLDSDLPDPDRRIAGMISRTEHDFSHRIQSHRTIGVKTSVPVAWQVESMSNLLHPGVRVTRSWLRGLSCPDPRTPRRWVLPVFG